MLFAFLFSLGDVAAGALDQIGELLRALLVKIDTATMCGDFAVHPLHLRARAGDLCVDLVQCAAFFGERVFSDVDRRPRVLLSFC